MLELPLAPEDGFDPPPEPDVAALPEEFPPEPPGDDELFAPVPPPLPPVPPPTVVPPSVGGFLWPSTVGTSVSYSGGVA
jgi:hypothetical protein